MSGDYIAIKLSNQSRKAIRQFCKDNQIPYRKPSGQLHTSVLVTENTIPTYTPVKYQRVDFQGVNLRCEKWDIDQDKQLLVIVFDCPQLVSYRETIIQMHKAVPVFKTFTPHVTLTYQMDHRTVNQLSHPLTQYTQFLELAYEYKEPRRA